MISETVVSSTSFHNDAASTDKSSMIKTKSHGPNLVPWKTAEGTNSHSETNAIFSEFDWIQFDLDAWLV